ncbi:hypothetical protein BDZ45DRAFT_216212 [Acephala macrosclerotiorum]|nr:hypothetical protein BDZ45DRAFT_216212 [Acephala macrosclerotiorum]
MGRTGQRHTKYRSFCHTELCGKIQQQFPGIIGYRGTASDIMGTKMWSDRDPHSSCSTGRPSACCLQGGVLRNPEPARQWKCLIWKRLQNILGPRRRVSGGVPPGRVKMNVPEVVGHVSHVSRHDPRTCERQRLTNRRVPYIRRSNFEHAFRTPSHFCVRLCNDLAKISSGLGIFHCQKSANISDPLRRETPRLMPLTKS